MDPCLETNDIHSLTDQSTHACDRITGAKDILNCDTKVPVTEKQGGKEEISVYENGDVDNTSTGTTEKTLVVNVKETENCNQKLLIAICVC